MIRILEPHVAQGAIGRPRKHNIRAIINAIRYIMRGGCQSAKRFSAMEDSV
ncbi:transposase [Wolbachia endosymbiont of Cantharis cryptica]|uniref:transposase n=1 Tax=Wolbachia endosymbiont of Cantharis cryptica TaxID=3066132 RepID=UPI00376ED57B